MLFSNDVKFHQYHLLILFGGLLYKSDSTFFVHVHVCWLNIALDPIISNLSYDSTVFTEFPSLFLYIYLFMGWLCSSKDQFRLERLFWGKQVAVDHENMSLEP